MLPLAVTGSVSSLRLQKRLSRCYDYAMASSGPSDGQESVLNFSLTASRPHSVKEWGRVVSLM